MMKYHISITLLMLFACVIVTGCSTTEESFADYVTSCTIESGETVIEMHLAEYSDDNFSFDKAYESMPIVNILDDAKVTFLVEEKCDTLTISEDYYEAKGNAVFISKETYNLTPNVDGNFELNVMRRNDEQDEKAIYFIKTQEGKQIIALQFTS